MQKKKIFHILKNFGNIAFGENQILTNIFLITFFKYEDTLLYVEEKPVAMLQMMPYTLKGIGAVTYYTVPLPTLIIEKRA